MEEVHNRILIQYALPTCYSLEKQLITIKNSKITNTAIVTNQQF